MLTSPLTCFLKAQITSLTMLHAEKFVTASGSEKDGAGLEWDSPGSWTTEPSCNSRGRLGR